MNINIHSANLQNHARNIDRPEACPGISLCFVVFAFADNQLKVLCQAPADAQSPEYWALPFGQVYAGQGIQTSAATNLHNLIQVEDVFHEQLQTYGGGGITPLTVAYYALLPLESFAQEAFSQRGLQWRSVINLPKLCSEQTALIDFAARSLRRRASCDPIVFRLLPDRFTLLQLQQVYETVLNTHIGKSNFRRKVAKMKFLVPSQEWQQNVAHRAARLYAFDERLYFDKCKDEAFLSF